MSTSSALATRKLTKRFGRDRGVFSLDLEVERGEIFGFLGPNGAGKTTTLRLLLGYLKPDEGLARVLGRDVARDAVPIRERIGYLPAEFQLYEAMTGAAFLDYLARFRAPGTRKRASVLADQLALSLEGPIRTYSKGMKQKLALIQALMHDPELVILDEPSEGFDPLVQQTFQSLLLDMRARGKTVFLSSHLLSEVEQICDRVGIIRAGNLLALETIAGLKSKPLRTLTLTFSSPLDAAHLDLPQATFLSQQGFTAVFSYAGQGHDLLSVLSHLPVQDFTFEKARLEEIFRHYYEVQAP